MLNQLIASYREIFTAARVRSFCVALLFLALSLVFQSYASAYSINNSQRFVGDFFLDNLPAIDLNLLIIEGALLAIVLSVVLLAFRPRYLIFTIKAAALFIALRSFFVAVTHLGIYPNQIAPGIGWADSLYVALDLQAGYFFSAHTGLPFLLALIFWKNRPIRLLYLSCVVLFGVSVLLTKVHYSIDVFAAPFMTYSILKISQYLFTEDYKLITDSVT